MTEHAWTEDPPSRTRHVVSNIRTFATDSDDTLRAESSLLLFRSRGDTRPPDIVCAGRVDRLRATDSGYRLSERRIDVDEAVLRTQNLAIFL
jgi:3-phenylpropionate/cinnamic acid dioxygenase small subunit